MPGAASTQIGHYLNSRSGSETITSNLTFTKPAPKPVAKPRSVYNDTNKEIPDSSPPKFPLATRDTPDASTAYPVATVVGNGGEDWGTKKRVETKTVKTIGIKCPRNLKTQFT